MVNIERKKLEQVLEAMLQVSPEYHLMPNRVGPKEAFDKLKSAIISAREALAQPAQEPVKQRAYETALLQWERWKTYALELQERLVKYEGGAPMVLNSTAPAQEPFGWYSAQEDEFMTDKIRKEHERLNSYTHIHGKFDLALYTTPPQRPWVGLTDEEIKKVITEVSQIPPIDFTSTTYGRAIEATLKEKNNV